MNYQTPGLMMDLNLGWFRQNGNCGYVLRPAIMREEVSYFSANARDSLPGVSAQLLHIKVISGQNLPKPRGSAAKGDVVEPYIYAEIHGIPADCAEQRTKTVSQNGDNPVFDESFEFQINLPELAALRFVVLDDDYIGDEFIGQYTIPFECLQPGYRHVPLQSLTGEFLANTTLFVHIAITNRRGGGKAHKRGLSVRKGRKAREYTSTKTTGIKPIAIFVFLSNLNDITNGEERSSAFGVIVHALSTLRSTSGTGPWASMVGSTVSHIVRSLFISHVDTVRMHCFMLAAGVRPHSSLKDTMAFWVCSEVLSSHLISSRLISSASWHFVIKNDVEKTDTQSHAQTAERIRPAGGQSTAFCRKPRATTPDARPAYVGVPPRTRNAEGEPPPVERVGLWKLEETALGWKPELRAEMGLPGAGHRGLLLLTCTTQPRSSKCGGGDDRLRRPRRCAFAVASPLHDVVICGIGDVGVVRD
ncbi:hypothetical protein CRUP_035131, partial [Coryphaenoides rupestris]